MSWKRRPIECASPRPVVVGAFAWPLEPGTLTFIVKLTYRMTEEGLLGRTTSLEPLKLHQHAPDRTLVYPSDFAPFKPACDVIILDSRVPLGALRVVPSRRHAAVPAPAPLLSDPRMGPSGDPLDPAADQAWSVATFDHRCFQAVPEPLRIAHPDLPLGIRIRGPNRKHDIALIGPAPEVVLLDGSGELPDRPIPLQCDTIVADLEAGRCMLSFRAVLRASDREIPSMPVFAVDLLGEVSRHARQQVLGWPRRNVTHPSSLRVASASAFDVWDEATESASTGGDDTFVPQSDEDTLASRAASPAADEAPEGTTEKVRPKRGSLSSAEPPSGGGAPNASGEPSAAPARAGSAAREGERPRETLMLREAPIAPSALPFIVEEDRPAKVGRSTLPNHAAPPGKVGRQTLPLSNARGADPVLPFKEPADRREQDQTMEIELPPGVPRDRDP